MAALVLLLGLAGCAAMTNEPATVNLQEPRLTCAQALRASRDALRKLGYTIEDVTPERGGEPGRVVAVRHAGWGAADPDSAGTWRATAEVRCDDSGATIAAVAEGEAMERMRFPGAFGDAFQAALAADRTPAPAVGVARRPAERGLAIAVLPLASGAASPFAEIDPLAAGILPVQIKIANRTDRRYRFDPAAVRLTTVEGDRRAPLAPDDLRRRLAAAVDAVDALLDAGIVAGEIAANEVRTGFVYFEAAAYQRASVVVTEVESGEAEGFSIRF
jgi:hypothetical protein